MPYIKDPMFKAAAGRIADRKERFAGLNDFVRAQGGSIISLPGAWEVVVEMLLESGLPSVLTDLGYDIRPDGEG